jgi:hypothetical protein
MYGTVMIASMKTSAAALQEAGRAWIAERGPSVGYLDQWVMQADDGRMVMAVRFESKDAYLKLADDPTQDEWYQTVMAPHLAGDPEWIDGEWLGT